MSHPIEFLLRIFFDLTKAFDTVDHQIILEKLENCGIRYISVSWFTSHLNHRK